jgi:hypothetical protein
MPAAIAEKQQHADGTGEEIREGNEVDGAETRGRVERRQRQMERRQDERLRIGDLRPAGKHVRRPERRLAACERRRHELQLGLELRLGVPRNRDGAGKPWPGEERKGRSDHRERGRKRQRPRDPFRQSSLRGEAQ